MLLSSVPAAQRKTVFVKSHSLWKFCICKKKSTCLSTLHHYTTHFSGRLLVLKNTVDAWLWFVKKIQSIYLMLPLILFSMTFLVMVGCTDLYRLGNITLTTISNWDPWILCQTLSWYSGYSVPPGAQWCPASCGKGVQRGHGRWRDWYHPCSLDLNQFWVLQWIGLVCTLIIFNYVKRHGIFITRNILQSPY